MKNPEFMIFVMELIGTIAFASSGAMLAVRKEMDLFGACVLGVTTAVGGGLLRDVMAQEKPYIFTKHVYACASLAGALVCVLFYQVLGSLPSMMSGAAAVLLIRLLAMRYRWNLPRIR